MVTVSNQGSWWKEMKGKEKMRRMSMMDSGFSQYLLMLILKLRASYEAYKRVKRSRVIQNPLAK